MSANARPDLIAFHELERHVRHLGDELAFFRRRALESERRARELGEALQTATRPATPPAAMVALPAAPVAQRTVEHQSQADGAPGDRLGELERENATLRADNERLILEAADARARLAEATERTRQLMERLRFLRQQQEAAGER